MIERGISRSHSLRSIAQDLDKAGIDPPGAKTINGYGFHWGARRRSDGQRRRVEAGRRDTCYNQALQRQGCFILHELPGSPRGRAAGTLHQLEPAPIFQALRVANPSIDAAQGSCEAESSRTRSKSHLPGPPSIPPGPDRLVGRTYAHARGRAGPTLARPAKPAGVYVCDSASFHRRVRTRIRSGVRSLTSVMMASQDLPLLARTVMASPTSSRGRALGLRPT